MKEGNDLIHNQDEPALSPGHEDRVVRALRTRKLVKGNAFPGAIVALLFMALLGVSFWAGTRYNKTGLMAATEGKYMLLLYRNASDQLNSKDHAGEYASWMKGLAGSGITASGEELGEETQWLGAGIEPAPAIVGYFVVAGASGHQALEIAQTCPHLKYGGSIEVRPIK
ncbi:MAG TPA: hypothetical protein VG737_01395 [Cyclobacteriaceae bacterium]|nr:hypothetical protein [Cyclobacteriaceae bacterium]